MLWTDIAQGQRVSVVYREGNAIYDLVCHGTVAALSATRDGAITIATTVTEFTIPGSMIRTVDLHDRRGPQPITEPRGEPRKLLLVEVFDDSKPREQGGMVRLQWLIVPESIEEIGETGIARATTYDGREILLLHRQIKSWSDVEI